MGRYLVVANQTLGGDHLIQAARERMLHERSEFWVLVPATRPAHVAESAYVRAGTDIASLAQQRLDMQLQRLHEAGVEADGEVGDPDPFKAISDTLRRKQFDEIILSTLPRSRSRWLRQDLPRKLERFGIPVTQVVSD